MYLGSFSQGHPRAGEGATTQTQPQREVVKGHHRKGKRGKKKRKRKGKRGRENVSTTTWRGIGGEEERGRGRKRGEKERSFFLKETLHEMMWSG